MGIILLDKLAKKKKKLNLPKASLTAFRVIVCLLLCPDIALTLFSILFNVTFESNIRQPIVLINIFQT